MNPSDTVAALRTKILSAGKVRLGPAWSNIGQPPHLDPFARLYFLHSGEARIVLPEGTMPLRPGCLYCIPAHTPFHYHCPRAMTQTFIHFTVKIHDAIDPFARMGWRREVRQKNSKALGALFGKLLATQRANTLEGRMEADGLLRVLLARMVPSAENPALRKMAEIDRFRPVLTFMENNLADPLRLENLAAILHLQPTYFSNLFTRALGTSPITCLLRLRVERAAALLWSTPGSVEEIAAAVGFANPFYFSRVFHRFHGISPSQYRRQNSLE